jgi:hypothetical protein
MLGASQLPAEVAVERSFTVVVEPPSQAELHDFLSAESQP